MLNPKEPDLLKSGQPGWPDGPILKDRRVAEYRVYVIFWFLKLDPEDKQAKREVATAKQAIKRWCHAALYGRRMIGFVVVSDESALELVRRLKEATEHLHELENVHVLAAPQPDDVACAAVGTAGPLNHWIRAGWVRLGSSTNPKTCAILRGGKSSPRHWKTSRAAQLSR
jgi:hypothetical protein